MIRTILDYKLIDDGDCIVVGLSGGPDSLCLFHALYSIKDQWHLKLFAVHVNHQFRPGDAEQDQKFVETFCKNLKVPCYSFVIDVNQLAKEQGITGEEAGRNVRYQCFDEIAEKMKQEETGYRPGTPVKIAVAQNLNDQGETILMRMMRGTGTDGLSGIGYKRKDVHGNQIIRPLLDLTREEIEQYCEENSLVPQIDKTNAQPIYTRNKVRLELIPYLQKNYNENILLALNRLCKIAKDDKEYLYGNVDKLIKEQVKVKEANQLGVFATIPLKVLQKAHPAIGHRVMMTVFGMGGLNQDIQTIHLEGADGVIREGRTSSVAQFPNGYGLKVSYDMIEFYKITKNESHDFFYAIEKYQSESLVEINELNHRLRVKLMKVLNEADGEKISPVDFCKRQLGEEWGSRYHVVLDGDKIQNQQANLAIRTRLAGDFIVPKGMTGRKKLKNFFIDAKIQKEQRDKMPLLSLGSEIVWIVGVRISENYKVDQGTKNILVLEYFKNI
ncbi:MAG: tRNA lysidine(34) synthetase TilS [Anaerovorax sp.]